MFWGMDTIVFIIRYTDKMFLGLGLIYLSVSPSICNTSNKERKYNIKLVRRYIWFYVSLVTIIFLSINPQYILFETMSLQRDVLRKYLPLAVAVALSTECAVICSTLLII